MAKELDKAELGAGDVPIQITNEWVILKPTLRAAQLIGNMDGGIQGAVDRCAGLHFNTILAVIVAGLGLTGNGSKDLPQRVYDTGVINLSAQCIRYLHIVANGGRPPSLVHEGDDTENPKKAN